MPTKPSVMTLNASPIQVLNSIRANASATYQDRIPEATRDNLKDIWNGMSSFQAVQNEFLNALVNRIARVILVSKSYSNPLRRFKKGVMEYGETVEEVFVNIANAQTYDPVAAQTDVFKRKIPDVRSAFHSMNSQLVYPVTVSNEQLRQAFLSYQGISDLISYIVDSLYSGAETDEYLMMKQLIVETANAGEFYPVTVPAVSADNAKAIVTKLKAVSNKLEFQSNLYNASGVITHTKKPDQLLILDADFDATIDVEVLAYAFNMSKAEFMGQRVLVDDFGSLTGCVAAIVDANWFMVFDNFIGFTENYNGLGLYWQYFYHNWKTFSVSPFANAVLFTTETSGVTSVSVTPETPTVTKGQSVQFSAAVVTSGYAPKGVIWSVTGDSDVTSTISPDGLLTVASNEANTTLTVTATSVYDGAKSDTATVTVTA